VKIVVGYDGSEAARRALDRAAELHEDGEPITVISVLDVHVSTGRGPAYVDDEERRARRSQLHEAEEMPGAKGIEVRAVEGHGDPARTILTEAKETGADLVAVGTRGHGPVSGALLGSVSSHVVHHAPCDVLVVR
jgi:nucleotide-binding universal stress UspA family protein